MKRNKLTHPRGYLMIETLISGAIIATILAAAMSVVASERVATTQATLRARASALAQERLNQLMADFNPLKQVNDGTNFATCQTCASPCNSPPAENWLSDTDFSTFDYPGFTRELFCREIGDAAVGEYGELFEIGVRVTYPSDAQDDTTGTDTVEHRTIRRDRYAN